MEIIKETSHMGKLLIKEISYDLSKEIIVKNHYSHKWNTSFGKINIGIFKKENDQKCLGVASFGNLMNPKSYINLNKDFDKDSVVELNRLWIDDELGMNAETILLGASWKIIRNDYPNIKAVQSFADGRLGCGTIYKASNFNYYGYTKTLFYENIETLETQHKVPMENTKRPDGMIKLNAQFAQGLLKPFYVKTYKYIYPLYKNVKLDLKQQEYPKYDKGLEYIDDYSHNENLYFRSIILSYLLDYTNEFNILKKFLFNNYDEYYINKKIKESLENKSIIEISKERKVVDKYEYLVNNKFSDFEIKDIEIQVQTSIFDFI